MRLALALWVGWHTLLLSVIGCGASKYEIHYQAASTSRDLIQQAGEALERVCTVDALDREGLAFGEGCESAREAQHTAVEAWITYVTAAATEGLDAPTVLRLGARVVATYREASSFLETRGVHLPQMEL